MAEYINVEKPFLDRLEQIGWSVINHGLSGIPSDPAISKRSNFKEVTLNKTLWMPYII